MRSILLAVSAIALVAVAKADSYNITIDWDTAEAIGESIADKYEEYSDFANNMTK